MTPKKDSISLLRNLVKMVQGRVAKRTRIQIQCPDIIETPLGGPATEDEELGTDQRHGMVVTTGGPGTIDHDARPFPRY